MKNLLHPVSRLANALAMAANACGTLLVLVLVGVVNYDVIAREQFHAPFMGAVELVQFSMVLIVFLQLPDVIRVNRMTRSDGFLLYARNRWPNFSTKVGQLIDLVACIFMVLIAIAIWPEFVEMFQTRDFFGVPGVFTAPWWPIKLVIFLSAVLCSVMFALKALLPAGNPTDSTQPATGD